MRIYLDTNVIRDCLKHRKLKTIQLMEIIRERKLECKSSIFSIMELIHVEKDDVFFDKCLRKGEEISKILRKRSDRDLKLEDLNDLSTSIDTLLASYNFIEFINLEGLGWTMALEICKVGNLDADDSIHLASAIGSNCDILLTSDEFMKKEGSRILEVHNNVMETNKTPEKKISLELMGPEVLIKKLTQDKSKNK